MKTGRKLLCAFLMVLLFAVLITQSFAASAFAEEISATINGWTLDGAAYDDETQEYILTENVQDSDGSIWYNLSVYDSFSLELDYYTGDIDGADGI